MTDERACEYCGESTQYIGTDYDMDGDYVAEYWCDNCKEHLYYVVPEPTEFTPPPAPAVE